MVEVTQADREAAIKIFAMIFGNGHSATYALARSDRHFLFDELARHRIAALEEARGDQVARVVEWLRKENGLCDCHAHSETECGCGAWDDWKTKPLLEIADAIERGEPFNG